jgi:hypothetical protein
MAAFIPETAYELAIHRAVMLSYSSVHKRRMCVFSVFAPYNQPETLRHRGQLVSAHPAAHG